MNGATRLSQSWVATVPDLGYQIVGVADHTGDGKADILWHHATRGEVWIWTMDGNARLAETWIGAVPDTGYEIAGTGDFNADGKADILWRHSTRGEVWVWLMDGTNKLSEAYVGVVPDTGYQIVRRDASTILPAPVRLAPADGSVLDFNGGRVTQFTWAPVPGAIAYVIELDCFQCCQANEWCSESEGACDRWQVFGTSFTWNWWGANPGRWRVWAIGADGKAGAKAPWWSFRYTG
jgi:hypothetical protein